MYCPEAFKERDPQVMWALIQDNPLADLCYSSDEGLALEYLPLILDARTPSSPQLIGHVARANPVWKRAKDREVLLGFHGPQAYVSPRAYASKQSDGQVVPTWNYLRVQVKSTLQLVEDVDAKRAIVEQMTDCFERSFNPPWRVSDAPEAYIQAMLAAIVGVRFTIHSMEGKWKVGQNQSPENQSTLKAYWRSQASPEAIALAAAMK